MKAIIRVCIEVFLMVQYIGGFNNGLLYCILSLPGFVM